MPVRFALALLLFTGCAAGGDLDDSTDIAPPARSIPPARTAIADGVDGSWRTLALPAPAAHLRSAQSCSTTGAQRTVVLLVDFPGEPLDITPAEATADFFGDAPSVDGFWREASYGLTSAEGTVVRVALNRAYTCDDAFAIEQDAIAAADAQVDFTQYQRLFILFPPGQGCWWAGLGETSCSSHTSFDGTFVASTAWLTGSYFHDRANTVQVAAHEGGHNLGLDHANGELFPDEMLGAVPAVGSVRSYADAYSTMGSPGVPDHYAAPHKQQLGWLDPARIATVEQGGMFSLAPYELPSAGTQALRVRRFANGDEWLWIEYRRSVGYDAAIAWPWAFRGVLVHYEHPGVGTSTVLLDATPGSQFGFLDGELAFGSSWTDPYSGLTIAVADGGGTAEVTITRGAAPCTRAAPTVTLAPIVDHIANGGTAQFNVTVTNNDSAACHAVAFALQSTSPLGFAGAFTPASVTLAPGATATATLASAAPTATEAGDYAAIVRADGTFGGALAAESAPATITVASACVLGSPVATLSPGSLHAAIGGVADLALSITSTDSPACGTVAFDITSTRPAGCDGWISPETIALPAGGSGLAEVHKIVPESATIGFAYRATATVRSKGASPNGVYLAIATADIIVDQPCVRRAPIVVLAPASSSTVAGTTKTLTMSVTSQDSASCSPSVFSLWADTPADWTAAMPNSVSVSTGATVTVPVAITPPSNAGGTTGSVTAHAGSHAGQAAATATISVTQPCVRSNPSVVLSPNPVTARAGTTASYTMTVTNRDSAACGGSTFALSSATPNGWTTTWSATSLSLAAGEAKSVTLGKTPPAMTTPGAYTVGATAQSATGSAQANATCNVTAALVTSASWSQIDKTTVSLVDTSWYGGALQAGVTVLFTLTLPNGSTTTSTATSGANGVATWKYKPAKPGAYHFTARAAYAGQTVTSTVVNFTVP